MGTFNDLLRGALAVLPPTDVRADGVVNMTSATSTVDTANKPIRLFVGEAVSSVGKGDYQPMLAFQTAGDTISLSRNPVQVRCTCMAYYFYFSWWNEKAGYHYGDPPPPYTPVANPKRIVPPRNPEHIPGMCKHLLAFGRVLKDKGKVTD